MAEEKVRKTEDRLIENTQSKEKREKKRIKKNEQRFMIKTLNKQEQN